MRDTQGILEMVLREIQVSCLPANIPETSRSTSPTSRSTTCLTVGDLSCPRRSRADRQGAGRGHRGSAGRRGSRRARGRRGWRCGSRAGRAGGAHRAQAQEEPEAEDKDKKERRRVSGPGRSSGSATPARLPRHAAQHGRARARRLGQEDQVRFQRVGGTWSPVQVRGDVLYLIKPQCFMNSMGRRRARHAQASAGPLPADLSVRRPGPSAGTGASAPEGQRGGHNGMRSLIATLGSDQLRRVKVALAGRPRPSVTARRSWTTCSPLSFPDELPTVGRPATKREPGAQEVEAQNFRRF